MNHLSIIGMELPVGLKSTGCATYRLSVDNEPVRRKQADDSIAELTPHSLSPVVVFESGVSESLTQLQVDAKGWLESKNLNVQLVIIMSLGTPIVNNTPTFTVEQWIVDPNPPIRTLRSNLKKAICYHTSDWTHAVPEPYSIDITRFYVLNAIPAPLANVTNMVLDANVLADLREWVINAWRVERV
ncbi:hypothetical protein EDB86DRAFT_3074117 [Lactarius hatsudake]|nr:hypothetical protein EDB86DRAFT_3074117 [Lactarius hatsudake]